MVPLMIDRRTLAGFLEKPAVQFGILGVIVFNGIILGIETSQTAMDRAGPVLKALDRACLLVFVVEIALKLVAYGGRFFRSGWNIFDFTIVAVSLAPSGEGLSILRALRILRVLRAVSLVPSLRRVVEGLISALPGMASVFALMSLLFYIAAVMATTLFGAAFDEFFGTIGRSAYSLFQIMTLESWSMGIVRPVMREFPWAWMFFVPFILVTTFAVVNLIVGLVVNSMQEAHSEESNAQTDEYRGDVVDRLSRIEAQLEALAAAEAKRGSRQPASDQRQSDRQ